MMGKELIMYHSGIEQEKCWFCKTHMADPESAYLVKMYGNVTRTGSYSYKLTWHNKTVKVPRCKECQRWNTVVNRMMFPLIFLCGVILLSPIIPLASGAWDISGIAWVGVWVVALIAAVGVIWLGAWVVTKLATPFSAEGNKKAQSVLCQEYPLVCELLKQGWKIGTHP